MGKLTFRKVLSHPAFVPACMVFGLLLRLAMHIFLPVEQRSDFAWYSLRAQELAAGMGYQESGTPTAFWPVGWPMILSLGIRVFGSLDFSILVINLLAYLLIMGTIYVFGKKIIGDQLATGLALLLYALYPNHIAYTSVAATELVHASLLMAAFGLLIVKRQSLILVFVAGLVFGISTLIKPQTIAFPVGAIVAIALIFPAYSVKRALVSLVTLYLALAVVLAPWTYRNYRVFDAFVLVSTNGGAGLIIGANDYMTGAHFDLGNTGLYDEMGISWDDRVANQVEMDEIQKRAALEWIKENPIEWASWIPKKIFFLWRKDTDGFWSVKASHPQYEKALTLVQWANQFLYAFILLLSLPAAYLAIRSLAFRRDKYTTLGFLFCAPVFVSLLAAVFTGQIRYHFSAMPLLLLAATWSTVNFQLWFLPKPASGTPDQDRGLLKSGFKT